MSGFWCSFSCKWGGERGLDLKSSSSHFMEVHARSHERLRDHPELLAQAEEMVAESIRAADTEVGSLMEQALKVMADNGVSHVVRYGTGPLLVPAEVVSPHCGTYLSLLMKADRLLGLLEYQRLRGLLTNTECDKEFAGVDRLLKAVQRTALRLAMGFRRRLNGAGEREDAAAPCVSDESGPGASGVAPALSDRASVSDCPALPQ